MEAKAEHMLTLSYCPGGVKPYQRMDANMSHDILIGF